MFFERRAIGTEACGSEARRSSGSLGLAAIVAGFGCASGRVSNLDAYEEVPMDRVVPYPSDEELGKRAFEVVIVDRPATGSTRSLLEKSRIQVRPRARRPRRRGRSGRHRSLAAGDRWDPDRAGARRVRGPRGRGRIGSGFCAGDAIHETSLHVRVGAPSSSPGNPRTSPTSPAPAPTRQRSTSTSSWSRSPGTTRRQELPPRAQRQAEEQGPRSVLHHRAGHGRVALRDRDRRSARLPRSAARDADGAARSSSPASQVARRGPAHLPDLPR